MTNQQIAQAIATAVAQELRLITQGKAVRKARKPRTYTKGLVVDDVTNKQLERFTSVARGFHRKGIKSSAFTLQSGGSDTVRTYKGWLANGRIVRRGQHGVKGLFHITQTQEHIVPKAVDMPADVQIGAQA